MERMKKLSEVLPASEQERIQRFELLQSQLCDSDTSADNSLEPTLKPFVEDSGYSYLDCSRRQYAQQSLFILQVFSNINMFLCAVYEVFFFVFYWLYQFISIFGKVLTKLKNNYSRFFHF